MIGEPFTVQHDGAGVGPLGGEACLLVLPFQRRVGLTLGYLGVNVVLFTIAGQSFEAIYGFMSWALAGLFLAWTVPAAVAEVRRMREAAAGGPARQRSFR